MVKSTKEIYFYRSKRAREEAQAEVNRTNNAKLIMLEDKGSKYHYAKLIIKHGALGDITTDLLLLVKEYMLGRYDAKIEIIEKERTYDKDKIEVIVALRKITGDVRQGYADYKKAITYAKRKLKLDTPNSKRTKENNKNGKNEQRSDN